MTFEQEKTYLDGLLERVKAKKAIPLLVYLSLWISPAYADLPYCDEVFVNGIQTFGKNSYVHFDYNARIYKESTNEIKTHHVQNHPWSIHKSCSVEAQFKLISGFFTITRVDVT